MENDVQTERKLYILQYIQTEELTMKKRLLSLLLVCVLVVGLLPALPALAATQSTNSPYAMIEYGYSSTVACGTVRYVSQVSSDSYFYSSYWPSGNFGYYVGAQVECGTASMSMALSYIGVDKTPKAILEANNGATVFGYGWGGSTYKSVGASSLTTAMSNYINGKGKYSPPVIHIPGYSSAGHYVVVVGQISSGKYQILDPWQRTVTTMTVSGSSATYSKYGSTTYDTIDQIHQWYKADASIDNDVTVTFNANGGSCSTTSREVEQGSAIGTLPTPTRSGYRFVGWYTAKDGGSAPITASTTVSDAVTYYAHWTSNRSTGDPVRFDAAGGILPGALASYTLTGTNTFRGTNGLILFNCDGQTVKTNIYGTEIAVDATGLVTGKRPYLSSETLTVPAGGFVLSGHGDNTGMCVNVANIHVGNYVSHDPASGTVTVYEDLNAYLASQKTVDSGSTYGDLPVPTLGSTPFLGWFTDPCGGTQITESSYYVTSDLYAHWGCDHRYTAESLPTACGSYQRVCCTCELCGASYTAYADEICTPWSETRPAGDLIEEKTQYAFSYYEIMESINATENGYTLLGSEWQYNKDASVCYVSSWPSGFQTSHELYTKYNNTKYTPRETDTMRIIATSDQVVGYLYYHWCDVSVTSCRGYQTGVFNTFHAYYDTTDPDNYECDTSDYSYKTGHSSCSNSRWWLAVEVREQKVSLSYKMFYHGRWGQLSAWSDSPLAGGVNRQVQTRTVYRAVNGKTNDHSYVNGVCSYCGIPCTHQWELDRCVICKMFCDHQYDKGQCIVCGVTCRHRWEEGKCLTCGLACSHSFEGGQCAVCGQADPGRDLYLFGYINGGPYGYDSDYDNLGSYLFKDGKLVVTFEKDSHVGVKTDDNMIWYMTEGYLGTAVTGAILYPSHQIADADLLFVPGGVEITFTLTENPDGTVTLSYQAAQPPVSLKPKSPALSFEDEVFINVFFTAENLGTLGLDDMGLITWTTARTDGTVADAEANIPGATYDAGTGRYIVRSKGIRPDRLGDTLYFKIYIRLTDGSYLYSRLLNYSPKTYANNMLGSASAPAGLKSLMVAMLNYGAAAQTHFSYKPYQLMNSSLTAQQKAMVTGYDASMASAVPNASADKQGIFTSNSGFSSRKPAISFEGAFCINYFFTPKYDPDNGITLYYWNREDFNAAGVLTTANATGKLKLEGSGTGQYRGDITGIAAKKLSEAVYVSAVYKNGGNVWTSGVLGYSIGAYCGSLATKGGTIADLAKATAVYGHYAQQYFNS
jgi:uncharacterized repeat protein (TIGR02543 family)